jgi:hypothetical protein
MTAANMEELRMTKFEDIQELADQLGVAVEQYPDRPDWCRLAMPSRITPTRMMPPLTLSTAEEILEDELQELRVTPIAAE